MVNKDVYICVEKLKWCNC